MFSLYFARFAQTRSVIDLKALSLSGGIAAIDILAPVIKPGSTSLTYEVQVAGSWTPLEAVASGNSVLHGLPPLLPFRAVFVGTTEVQPGLNLAESVLRYSRPRTDFKHLSVPYALAAPSQALKVIALIENRVHASRHGRTRARFCFIDGPAQSGVSGEDRDCPHRGAVLLLAR
jgi:hypothetical protein